MTGFTAADVTDQSGKCFIVTGANAGIGFEASKVLAGKGARVVLACRDKSRAEEAMARIGKAVPGADLAFLPLDQADLASVRRAAELAAREAKVDVLLNNAGVMVPPLTRTKDGFELQLGVNHLGTFALTGLLLPKLAETPGARVVITASLAHVRGQIDWDDLNSDKGYSKGATYAQSKLANLLFMFELDRRLRAAGSPVSAFGCHPGVSMTELMRHIPMPLRLLTPIIRPFFNSPAAAAWPALQAATSPAAVPGEYYGPQSAKEMRGVSGVAHREPQALDAESARRLWDLSIQMTGVDPGLQPA
jgi:NAD(P)-dependent dehydrogenase (short-subunit alcohol dehydrogenase family)